MDVYVLAVRAIAFQMHNARIFMLLKHVKNFQVIMLACYCVKAHSLVPVA